jgi:ankyrin repeat protein
MRLTKETIAKLENVSIFFELLISQASTYTKILNVCLSSRHYPNITLKDCPEIWLEDHNKGDISTYVQRTLGTSSTDEQTMELVQMILSKASGVFLWVVLVIEMLVKAEDDGDTMAGKREKLQTVPAGLEQLFTQILDKLSPQETYETYEILKWVAFSRRQLRPVELFFALTLKSATPLHSVDSRKNSEHFVKDDIQMLRFIRSRSRGPVEIKHYQRSQYDSGSDNLALATVQFIHESVGEFLICRGFSILDPSLGYNVSGLCNDSLAKSCLRYLSSLDLCRRSSTEAVTRKAPSTTSELGRMSSVGTPVDAMTPMEVDAPTESPNPDSRAQHPVSTYMVDYGAGDIRGEYPFLDYSVKSFLLHVEIAEAAGVPQAYLIQLLSGSKTEVLDCWHFFARLFDPGSPVMNTTLMESETPTLLEVASAMNIISLMEALLSRYAARTPDFKTSLRIGAAFGHFHVVQLILRTGVNSNAINGFGNTALHIAAQMGSAPIVEVILQYGAEIHLQNRFDWTALHLATESGNLETVKLILNAGAQVNVQNSEGLTALAIAARRGKTEVVQKLLAAGAELDVADNFGQTPLHLAALFGHDNVVELLLERRPNLEAVTSEGRTPLAITKSHEVSRLLLAAGAKPQRYAYSEPEALDRAMTASPDPFYFSHRKRKSTALVVEQPSPIRSLRTERSSLKPRPQSTEGPKGDNVHGTAAKHVPWRSGK